METRARALGRIQQYLKMRTEKPINGLDDVIHGVHTGTEWEGELRLSDLLLAVDPPPSGASPQAETSEAEQKYGIAFGRLDGESIDEHIASIKRLMGILAPVSPVEPEPPEELPCYCDIPSHILDLGCPRHQAPQCEPEPPWREKYNELLFAVARAYPGESRHDTALRYIREKETAEACGPKAPLKVER